jgi:hypothetical protein
MLLELTSRNALSLIFLSLSHQKMFTRVSPVVYTVILPPASLLSLHLQVIATSTTIGLHEQVTLRTFNVPI